MNGRSAFKEHAAEWGRGLKRRRNYETFSMSESIALLAKIIYEREVAEENPPVFTFSQLRSIAEIKDERLRLFFDEIEESACIREKNKEESFLSFPSVQVPIRTVATALPAKFVSARASDMKRSMPTMKPTPSTRSGRWD